MNERKKGRGERGRREKPSAEREDWRENKTADLNKVRLHYSFSKGGS